jgi:hypothetical protein
MKRSLVLDVLAGEQVVPEKVLEDLAAPLPGHAQVVADVVDADAVALREVLVRDALDGRIAAILLEELVVEFLPLARNSSRSRRMPSVTTPRGPLPVECRLRRRRAGLLLPQRFGLVKAKELRPVARLARRLLAVGAYREAAQGGLQETAEAAAFRVELVEGPARAAASRRTAG